jgi:hypothetical protein
VAPETRKKFRRVIVAEARLLEPIGMALIFSVDLFDNFLAGCW